MTKEGFLTFYLSMTSIVVWCISQWEMKIIRRKVDYIYILPFVSVNKKPISEHSKPL